MIHSLVPLVHLGPSLFEVNESMRAPVSQSHKQGFKVADWGKIKVGLLWGLSGFTCQSRFQESCPGGIINGGMTRCGLRT